MPKVKEIPEGFDSWMQFYDKMNEFGLLNRIFSDGEYGKTLEFYNSANDPNHFTIKIETLKAKCFDELNSKRIPINEANILISAYRHHVTPNKYFNKVLEMINSMTLPK